MIIDIKNELDFLDSIDLDSKNLPTLEQWKIIVSNINLIKYKIETQKELNKQIDDIFSDIFKEPIDIFSRNN